MIISSMTIKIQMFLDDGTMFSATASSIERAYDELAALERKYDKLTAETPVDL